jgi:hypothetical protein
MLDANGTPVHRGSRVVVLSGHGSGKFGYVHKTSDGACGQRGWHALVYDVTTDVDPVATNKFGWGAWLKSSQIALVPVTSDEGRGE